MSHTSKLESIRGLLLDMDGVLWRGGIAIEGASAFLGNLSVFRMPHLFVTNNATSTTVQISQKAQSLALDISSNSILTSSQAAIAEIQRKFPPTAKVYVIGEAGLRDPLQAAQYDFLETADHADVVVVGLDRNVTWEKLSEAAYAIEAGAAFIGTNGDVSLPTERGFAPGNGAILAALEQTTGVQALVVGKPEPHMFIEAARRLQLEPEQILVIGDRLETDIAGGRNAGMKTALILTGAAKREDLPQASIQPDFIFETLNDLSAMLWSESN